MIRHTVVEGWLLVRSRMVVSAVLALALAVPICLAGVTAVGARWLQPLTAYSSEATVVAVLLHPKMDVGERSQWLAQQAREHPEWNLSAVSAEQLAARLGSWFPYLEDLLAGDRGTFVPPLVEITTTDVSSVEVLESNPSVVAIGPRSSVHRLIGGVARETGWILGILTAVLLITAAALAAIWVHLEIYRHADEMTILRLIGATEGAIRGPFLFAVGMPGVVATLLSIAGTVFVVRLSASLTTALGLPPVVLEWWVLGGQVVLGCVLPVAAGGLTLARHAYSDFEG